jgi:hypothetical protein
MSAGSLRLKRPVVAVVALAVMILGLVAAYAATTRSEPSPRGLSVELLSHNKNDGKDACPNDGNAGKGNDNKGPNGGCRQHPPTGGYGNVN